VNTLNGFACFDAEAKGNFEIAYFLFAVASALDKGFPFNLSDSVKRLLTLGAEFPSI